MALAQSQFVNMKSNQLALNAQEDEARGPATSIDHFGKRHDTMHLKCRDIQ